MVKTKPAAGKPAPKAPVKAAASSNAAQPQATPAKAVVVNVPSGLITAAKASTLSLDEIIAGIRQTDSAYRGAFASFGIHRFFLERMLSKQKPSPAVTTVLREKCGLTAGTISHTAYAAKTFSFVVAKKITEAEYAGMTCRDMIGFVQVQGNTSKKQLDIDQAVKVLRDVLAKGGEVAAEFDSLWAFGMTAAEKEKAAEVENARIRLDGEITKSKVALVDKDYSLARKLCKAVLAENPAHAVGTLLLGDIDKAEVAAKNPAMPVPVASVTLPAPTVPGNGPAPTPTPGAPTVPTPTPGPTSTTPPTPAPAPTVPVKPDITALGAKLDELLKFVSTADKAVQKTFLTANWTAADALLKRIILGAATPTNVVEMPKAPAKAAAGKKKAA